MTPIQFVESGLERWSSKSVQIDFVAITCTLIASTIPRDTDLQTN